MDEVLILVGILYLIPLFRLIHYYLSIQIAEYLILGGLFLILSINSVAIAIMGTGNFTEVATSVISNLILIIVFKDFLNGSNKKLFLSVFPVELILGITNLALLVNNTYTVDLFRGLLYNIMRIMTGSYIFYV